MRGLKILLNLLMKYLNFSPTKRDFTEYQKDLKTKKAVERNVEIIGEAINRIGKHKETDFQIVNAQKIISTRNRIAHEYDNISDEVIWTISIRVLPELKKEIQNIVQNQ